MVADSSVSRLHAYFRDLFLDELRVDDGWAEYIDLLVRHLDLAGFDYLQERGVPYYFRLSDFLGVSGSAPSAVSPESPCSITSMGSGEGGVYVTLNAPRAGAGLQWLDFGAGVWVRVPRQKCVYVDTDYVEGDNIEEHIHTEYFDIGGLWRPAVLRRVDGGDTYAGVDVASVLYNDGLNVALLEGKESTVVWSSRVELTVYSNEGTSSQPCMLVLRVPRYVEKSVGVPLEVSWSSDAESVLQKTFASGVYPFTVPEAVEVNVGEESVTKYYLPIDWGQVGLQVDSIPHLVNGAMIRSARLGAGAGQQLYGVSPSARSLFATMYGLGLDYRKFPFRFYLANGVFLGESDVQYPQYVSIRGYLDPVRSVKDVYPTSVGVDRWPVVSWGYGEAVGANASAEVVGFVASEPTPTDALRDRWGVDIKDGEFYSLVDGIGMNGVLQELYVKYGARSIFGYDKKLWVVINNGYGEAWYYLGSPYRRRGEVSIVGDWDGVVEWDVSGRVMDPEQFQLESDESELNWRVIDGPGDLAAQLKSDVLEGVISVDDFGVYTNSGAFVIGTPSNGDVASVEPLCTELSHPFYLPEGLTKHYEDLSLQDSLVPVERLTVVFLGTKEAFGEYLLGLGLISSLDELDAYLEWLKGVLERSVPIGIPVEILFVPPPSVLDLELDVVGMSGVDTAAGSEVYLLSNPGEVHIQEGMSMLYPVVVRSNVGWWVDMDVKLVLGVRLAGASVWESSIDVDVTDGPVSVEVYAASDFGMKVGS